MHDSAYRVLVISDEGSVITCSDHGPLISRCLEEIPSALMSSSLICSHDYNANFPRFSQEWIPSENIT